MVKVILAIVLAIAVIGGVIALIGSRLPVGHVATRSVVINAPADLVFQAMTDFASTPAWRQGLKSVNVATDPTSGRQRITETSSSGSMTMEVEQLVPPTRMVMRIVDEEAFGGVWAYALEPQGNATRVTISEHGEVYNPLFRFISRYVMGYTGALEAYLVSLGMKFGQSVMPEDATAVPLKTSGG